MTQGIAWDCPCAAPGCERAAKVRGYCNMHYSRLRRTGDALSERSPGGRRQQGPKAPCSVAHCGQPVLARGWCKKHYRELRDRPECVIKGCGGSVVGLGYCNKHYLRLKIHGDPLAGKDAAPRVVDVGDGTRVCRVCKKSLPLDSFDRDRSAKGGRRAQCKACRGAQVADWYAANRERQRGRAQARRDESIEKHREQDRARYYRDKPKRLALATEYSNRRRAVLANAPSVKGITKLRLRKIHGDLCRYCGCVMSFVPASGHEFIPGQASIEHIIPLAAGGSHTWDNVALACRACNTSKNSKTPEEWARHKEAQRARLADGVGGPPDLDATA